MLIVAGGWCVVDARLGRWWWGSVVVCGSRRCKCAGNVGAVALTVGLEVLVLVMDGGWCVVAGGGRSVVVVLGGSWCQCAGRVWAQ